MFGNRTVQYCVDRYGIGRGLSGVASLIRQNVFGLLQWCGISDQAICFGIVTMVALKQGFVSSLLCCNTFVWIQLPDG